jgi:predicted MFS family arabinose efflux permease
MPDTNTDTARRRSVEAEGRSAWAPMRVGAFRAVWVASLASNVGSWMHLVGAAWLMTSLTSSAAMVALLQSANALPSFLLALPGGAMADVFDRRRLILVTQTWQLVTAALLGVLTVTHVVTPWVLLGATVVLGAGAALGMPAFAAVTPELVPRDELPAAISLNSMTVTASQAVGPALGGVLVAVSGPGAVFFLNAVSFVAVVSTIARWRGSAPLSALPPEHVVSAVRTGLRYTVNAPEFVTVLVRTIAYILAFSAVPALLAVATRTRMGGSAFDFGLLLGISGVGGVAGALALPRIRHRTTADAVVLVASLAYSVTLVAVAVARSPYPVAPFLLTGGFAMMAVISTLSIAAHEVLPDWVRGRGLAVFLLTFQLGIAGGAAAWGAVANQVGAPKTFVAAAVLMVATIALIPLFPLRVAEGVDVRHAYQPEPHPPVQVDPDDGPVLIATEYDVPAPLLPAFRAAAHRLKQVRRREGALRWGLFEDVVSKGTHVENYMMTSWTEHKRQGDRRTGSDQRVLDEVGACHRGEAPPRSRYLVGRRLQRRVVKDPEAAG